MQNLKDLPEKISVKVSARAKSEKIKKEILQNGKILFKVYVTQAPENGKANEAVIKTLSKTLKVPKFRLRISHGFSSSEKIIEILK